MNPEKAPWQDSPDSRGFLPLQGYHGFQGRFIDVAVLLRSRRTSAASGFYSGKVASHIVYFATLRLKSCRVATRPGMQPIRILFHARHRFTLHELVRRETWQQHFLCYVHLVFVTFESFVMKH